MLSIRTLPKYIVLIFAVFISNLSTEIFAMNEAPSMKKGSVRASHEENTLTVLDTAIRYFNEGKYHEAYNFIKSNTHLLPSNIKWDKFLDDLYNLTFEKNKSTEDKLKNLLL